MLRYTFLILLMLGAASPVRAGNWAEDLFPESSFDFGAVPRGQQVRHAFPIVNNTKATVHIANAAASMGPTTAWALKHKLAPGEQTSVIVQINTGAPGFIGVRGFAIYIRFDEPRVQEVTLWVQANSRTEISFFPDDLDFRKIKRGTTPTSQMVVRFIGKPEIRVTEAICDSKFIQAKLQELRRQDGEVIYQVFATVQANIPEGKWYSDIWLTTNDPKMPKVRVPVVVEVESAP